MKVEETKGITFFRKIREGGKGMSIPGGKGKKGGKKR